MTTPRRGNDDLFLGLMVATADTHKRATGHDAFAHPRPLYTVGCDACMWLRTVNDELEARQYDGMAEPAQTGE